MAGKTDKSSKSAAKSPKSNSTGKKNDKPEEKSAPKTEATQSKSDSRRLVDDILASADPQKVDEITRNLTEALVESQKLLAQVSARRLSQPPSSSHPSPDPFGTGKAWLKVTEDLVQHPGRLVETQMKLWEGHMGIWRSFLTGESQAETKDRRFADEEWKSNPFFEIIRRSYELNSQFLSDIVNGAETLDDETRRKAKFFVQQTADAFSPTNFFSTNPTALKAMLETGGQSLLDGLRLANEDIRRGHGRLLISQTDGTAFKVGENVATAPGKVVYRNDILELIQYEPTTKKAYEIPLLIFPPWINKFYILDLREENSMIRWLVSKGYTVFVASWRSADHSMKDVTWDDYVRLGAYQASEKVSEITGSDTVNAVGYCIGGTMLASALAHMAAHEEHRIASATFFASQSDFREAGDLLVFTDDDSLSYIEDMIEQNGGIMAGEDMAETFNYLRASDLVWRYVIDSYMLGKKPRPFDLLFWNSDQTNIPGRTHITYLRDLYAKNALANGQFRVLGEVVDLGSIGIPTLFQAGRDDHISPFRSVYRAAKAFGGQVEFVLAGSGHIAGVINHPDAKKYQHWTNPDLPATADDWLENAQEHPGSWWPHWHDWLKAKSGSKIEARHPEDTGLGNAPGTYVLSMLADLGVGPSAR